MESQDISLAVSVGSDYADTSKPYIVLRFGWHDLETNYMDMRAVGWSADPEEGDPDRLHPLDIILGKVLFQESPPGSGQYIIADSNPFDFSRRHDVFIKETESVSGQFRVSPSELDPKKVFISGGKVNTSKGRFILAGAEFPAEGIPDTGPLGRTDLIAVDAEGRFQLVPGIPSAAMPAPSPKYRNYKVLAEIQRGPNRTDINGTDIVQITDATVRGPVSSDDFPLIDFDKILPAADRNVEPAFNYILHRVIAIRPQDVATLGAVLRRNIKWGTKDPDEIYAANLPVKDTDGLFAKTNVEDILAEIAGKGRTEESLKSLAEAIAALADVVSGDEKTMDEHIKSTFDNGETVHGLTVVTDEEYPVP